MSATPTVIEASATLNAQKCQPRQYTSTKSSTYPNATAVDEIARCAGDDERQADPAQPLRGVERGGVERQSGQRRRGDERHDDRLVGEVYGIQHPECCAGIVHARQVEESGDDRTLSPYGRCDRTSA